MIMKQAVRTRAQSTTLILALGLLNALTPFTIDLYLPAFPDIARDLGVDVQRMSLSVSIYFIGFAVGQVLYGPLLDRFGRKPPIYFGLALYMAASLGCRNAGSFNGLLAFRLLSALGGSAASVGATAMVRDYFPAKDAAKVFSMLMLVLSASPLFAPSVGSIIVGLVGWRAIFLLLTALALGNLALVAWVLPKGYEPDPSVSLRLKPMLREFRSVLQVRGFWVPTVAGSFSFAGLFVFVAGSPAIFMEGFGVSTHAFGMIFALLAGGMIVGGQLNHLFVRRSTPERILRSALAVQVVVSALFLAAALVGGLALVTTIVFLFLLLLFAGIGYPNAAALALEPFSKNLGSASAMLGFIQLGVGAVVATALGVFHSKGLLSTAAAMAGSALIGWVVLKLAGRTRGN